LHTFFLNPLFGFFRIFLFLLSWSYWAFPAAAATETPPRGFVWIRFFSDCSTCQASFLDLKARIQNDESLSSKISVQSVDGEKEPQLGFALIQSEFVTGGRSGDFVVTVALPDGSPVWSAPFDSVETMLQQIRDVVQKMSAKDGQMIEKHASQNRDQWMQAISPRDSVAHSRPNSQLIHRYFSDLAAQLGQAKSEKKGVVVDPYLSSEHVLTLLSVFSASRNQHALIMAKDILDAIHQSNEGSSLVWHFEFKAGDFRRTATIDFEENARLAWSLVATSRLMVDQGEAAKFQGQAKELLRALASAAAKSEAIELSPVEVNRTLDYLFRLASFDQDSSKALIPFLQKLQRSFEGKNLVIGQSYIAALISEGIFTENYDKLVLAVKLEEELIGNLWDQKIGLFKEQPENHPILNTAIYSWAERYRGGGNSIALMNLSILRSLGFKESVGTVFSILGENLAQISYKHSLMLPLSVHAALISNFGPIVRATDAVQPSHSLGVWPYVIDLKLPPKTAVESGERIPILENKPLRNSISTVYVCRHQYCFAPNRSGLEIEREIVANPLVKVGRFTE